MTTPADADFDCPRDPMTRAGLFLFGVAWVTSWAAVWALWRAGLALMW